jgi:hypothetical protein
MPAGADEDLRAQVARLDLLLARNPVVVEILERTPSLHLPDWYLGAGAITQTVWNVLHGFEPTSGIKDYDLVYFDPTDLSARTEEARERDAAALFGDLDMQIDLTNEARVHLWYEERFGIAIAPYRSTEHAISTWPTTASSIGVRRQDDEIVVCAPFGLNDLFAMIVRPNKTLIEESVYLSKAERWHRQWPRLVVIPWD